MTLGEYLTRMSHREHLVQLAYSQEELNHPGRIEYYLMAIACEVRRVLAKDPSRHKLDDMRLEFRATEEKKASGMTKEQMLDLSKQRWTMFGRDKDGNDTTVRKTRSRPLAVGETHVPEDG